MNPIAGETPSQQEPKNMQDVVPPPRQAAPQSSAGVNDAPIQTEIVNDMPVKIQNASSVQAQSGANSSAAKNPASSGQTGAQDDKGLNKVLKDVNQQVKKTDSQMPKVSTSKRWESTIITVVALGVAAALCLAAISAFKK